MCNVLKKAATSRWCCCWLYIFLIFNFIPNFALGFNLDLSNFIRHSKDAGSMFGFSIAMHRNTLVGGARNWVIVGAPKFNDSAAISQNITESGAVFKCDILNDDQCSLIPFDSKGNQMNDRREQIDTKSHQWLGATVSSGGENGLIVACAPRYVFHTMQPSRMERIEPVGTCFTAKNFATFTEFSPCRTNYWGYHRQGSCQAGFSAAITKNNQRLFIGAPGSWYWQGQVYSINTAGQFPYKPPLYQDFGTGQLYNIDVTDPLHKVYATGESSSSYDDSYFGYSVATGDFNGDGIDGVAVGMPRGSGLYGRVAIYNWKLNNLLNITGTQIGSYFGYSMCSVDVDGDNLDDLVIGAPMHAEPNNEGKYDVGRVYIILQKHQNKFFTNETRDGITSRGRFGLSVASLRDVNLDGYGDFAVGAPYDGPNNNGAVYIFYGSPQGPLKKPSQVIYAEDLISTRYPKTFGFSLAGGIDLDGNLYPDLSVGAYESDSIFIFKARPVAVVEANTTLLSHSKLVNLEEKQCTVPYDDKPVTCTNLKSCIKYDGVNLPTSLEFDVSWALDVKKIKNPRMFFLNDPYRNRNIHNRTYTLYKGRLECLNETIYIADGIVDKLTPLEVEMRYQLRHNQVPTIHRRPRDIPQPIIDYNRETVLRDSINIQKNCGADAICTPNLQLRIKTVDKYLIGSKEPLTIDVSVSNVLEDAFEATFYMTVPPDLDYISTKKIGDSRDTSISCTAPSIHTNYVLICRLGNPFAAGKVVNFRIGMKPPPNLVLPPSYDFYMEANSTNPEMSSTRHDNIIKKNIGMWVKTELSIEGTSDPSFDYYQKSDYKRIENATEENEIGPNVVHIYNIRNNGPSAIEQAEVFIFWPYQTHSGDDLMYLLQNPELSGNIQCDPNLYVNEKNLILDPELSKKSYLKTAGVVLKAYAGHENQNQGGHIDKSSSSGTNSGGASLGTRVITEEDKRKFEEEATIESTGDASLVHNERAKAAAESRNTGQVVHTSSWNRTTTYDSSGNPVFVESSTEYYSGAPGNPTYYGNNYQTPPQSGHSIYSGSSNHPAERGTSSQYSSTSSNAYPNQGYGQQGYRDYQGSHNSHPIPVVTHLEKAAQGGEGFQAGVLNLEPIPRQSVDDDFRARGQRPYPQGTGQTLHSQGSYSSQSGYSGGQNSRPNTQYYQSRTISSGGQPVTVSQEGYYDDEDRDASHYSSRSYGRHNIDHRRTPENYQRLRRQARSVIDEDIENTVHCKATKCAMIRCVAGPLVGENVAWIAIRTRLVAHTISKITTDVPLNVSTMAVARVTRLPHIGARKDKPIAYEIFYTAIPEPQPKSDMVPLWVVVLSACAGAIILLLLAFLLYKCGFFDRNRPSDSQERQPLNSRNGYHGDEHL